VRTIAAALLLATAAPALAVEVSGVKVPSPSSSTAWRCS